MKVDKWFHLYSRKFDIVFEEVSCPAPIEWISVSEGLPKDMQKVLISTKEGNVWTAVWGEAEKLWFDDYDETVIAWLPLPEPFDGGDEMSDFAEDTNVPTNDCISRQAAIDAVLDSIPNEEYWIEQVKRAIFSLPSAQPEIIHCKDCRHNGSFDTDCPIDWNGKEYCSFAER